jgi:hypothetical protein
MKNPRPVAVVATLMLALMLCPLAGLFTIPQASADPGDGDVWWDEDLQCMSIDFLGLFLCSLGIKNPWWPCW